MATPAVVAGTVSTTLFVVSYLPMLVKAYRTKDLSSYSRGNLVLANIGNAVHSIYVFSLPVGPIWVLHGFYLASTAAMLIWHRQHAGPAGAPPRLEDVRDQKRDPRGDAQHWCLGHE